MELMPACPDLAFDSIYIRKQGKSISEQSSPKLVNFVKEVFERMQTEKREWYDESKHLRPIASRLQRIVKADTILND